MPTTVTKIPQKYSDPYGATITEVRTYTALPAGYVYLNFLGTEPFTEPGKQTWRPGEARCVTTAEAARIELVAPTLFEPSGGPGNDALAG